MGLLADSIEIPFEAQRLADPERSCESPRMLPAVDATSSYVSLAQLAKALRSTGKFWVRLPGWAPPPPTAVSWSQPLVYAGGQ